MLKQAIQLLMKRENLSREMVEACLEEIISNENMEQSAAFLTLLRAKGETKEELQVFIRAFQKEMIPLPLQGTFELTGTGGDGKNTVNISTPSALVLASYGVKVLKHGNRSVSSKSGSSDVLEEMGIEKMKPQKLKQCFEKLGVGFAFAPYFHPSFQKVKELRSKLRVPTTFNLLGPLFNPSMPKRLMIGVYDPRMLRVIAEILQERGVEKALVFHGQGLDEISSLGPVDVMEVTKKSITSFVLDPKEYGFSYGTLEEMRGKGPKENARILEEVFKGKRGAIYDTIRLNVACGLYVAGKVDTIREGIEKVTSLEGGLRIVEVLREFSSRNLLEEICREKEREVEELKKEIAENPHHILRQILSGKKQRKCAHKLEKNLKKEGLSIIAEIKRASPTRGKFNDIKNPAEIANTYQNGGADAISVLTDQKSFLGSNTDLMEVASIVDIPVLRKDFIIDSIQLAESVLLRADAVLLIVSVLKDRTKEFLKICERLGLEAIVEVHTEEELKIAQKARAKIIGINNRDLKTFETDIGVSLKLCEKKRGALFISESGIHTTQDAKRIKEAGFDGILVGEALSKSEDPFAWISEVKAC